MLNKIFEMQTELKDYVFTRNHLAGNNTEDDNKNIQ